MQTSNVVSAPTIDMPKQGLPLATAAAIQSNSLALELLDTSGCLDLLAELEHLENSVFGPDFTVPHETMLGWARSGGWFCAAVTGQAVVGRQQIFSMLSILLTTEQSRDLLLAGYCTESELTPWTQTVPGDKPSLYLASVISAASEHLQLLYQSLAADLQEFRQTSGLQFHSGFSIASGPAGYSHLARNGFRTVTGRAYRDHYPLMTIDATSAVTPFWRELVGTHTEALAAPKASSCDGFTGCRAIALVS
jgi:hypothetical protein